MARGRAQHYPLDEASPFSGEEFSMNEYSGPIFDCDMHVIEPYTNEAWLKYLPQKFKKDWSVGYRWEDGGKKLNFYVGDRQVMIGEGHTGDGKIPKPGSLHDYLKAMKNGEEFNMRVDPTPDMLNRDERIKKLDEFHVEGAIVFVGSHVSILGYLDEVEPANAVLGAYNRWMAQEWGFNYRDRIYATPVLNLMDLDASVKEAEWAVKQGARVCVMPAGPAGGRSPADPAYDRFWSILNEAKVQVTFHISEAPHMHPMMRQWGETPLRSRIKQSAWIWVNAYGRVPIVQTFSSFIFHNFFARYPNIKLMSVENGCEWVPPFLTDMDKARGMARNAEWPCGQLKQRPSQIFKENCFVVAYPEDDCKGVVEATGASNWLVMGSDYPHAEGVARPADFAPTALAGLAEKEIDAIMYANGRRFLPKAA